MNSNNRSKSQLFLLEFTIVVLFFAICASICVLAFIKADQISKANDVEKRALVQLQNAAEIIKVADYKEHNSVGADLEKYLGAQPQNLQAGGEDFVVFYDDDFVCQTTAGTKETSIVDCKYTMSIEIDYSDENMMTATLCMTQNTEDIKDQNNTQSEQAEISNLVVKKYLPVI